MTVVCALAGGWGVPAIQPATAYSSGAMLGSGPEEESLSAREVVERLQRVLIEASKGGEKLGYEGRWKLIEPVVDRVYGTPTLAQLVLGEHWGGMEASERKRFVRTLHRLTIATYAARFNEFNGQRFEVVEEREMREDVRLVRTMLRRENNDDVSLDYLLRRFDSGWRIVNILADGVSEVSVKRVEYDEIIRKSGLEGLFSELEEKIAAYEAGEEVDDDY